MKQLCSFIRPTQKSIYGLHDPNDVTILTQLRLGLIKLNSRKSNYKILDTVDPMCPINDGNEHTEYFLLKCHAYGDQRRNLLGAINEMFQLHSIRNLSNQAFVHIILYGDNKFTDTQN